MKNNKSNRKPYLLIHGNNKASKTQLFKKNIDDIQGTECTHQNDKSDLDSLNSEYFKNSSHQNKVSSKVRLYKNQNTQKNKNHHFNKTIQKYQDNSQSSAFPESTTSITDSSSSSPNQSDNESYFEQGNAEANDQSSSNQNTPGVIVYDTVYLSSEESSEDPSVICKPVIISAVEKKFKTFSDYAKVTHKNILGNLTFINSIETKTNDNQYYSLPDCEIGQSLNLSEKIDDKLRSSYNFNFSIDEKSVDTLNDLQCYSNDNDSQPEDEVKENFDNIANVRIIVTDEQNEIIENTNTTVSNIEIVDVKKSLKNTSLRKGSIKSKSRGIRRSVVRTQSFKTMSRPQILQIFDTKRKIKPSTNNDEHSKTEFLDKVNSVKKFWSKLSDDIPVEPIKTETNHVTSGEQVVAMPFPDPAPEFKSFSPAIEVVNLNEKKKITTSNDSETSNNDNELMFDHVRYKILKSNAVRNNIIIRNKKDINYGGLLQYLQEYKFQELLANNNVVIVEPVRTKIDARTTNKRKKITEKSRDLENENKKNTKKNNVKKHFFYQPIQVNREMHEDELPTPDIVRKTKQLFENELKSKNTINKHSRLSSSSDNLDLGRRHNFQATVFNFTPKQKPIPKEISASTTNQNKWEILSVSSGISSGKQSPPCCDCYVDEKFNENSEEVVKSNIDLANLKSNKHKNLNENYTAHYVSEVSVSLIYFYIS